MKEYLTERCVYVDPHDGNSYRVHHVPKERNEDAWTLMDYYIIGEYLYQYIGRSTRLSAPNGTIYIDRGIFHVNGYDDEEEANKYRVTNIRSKDTYGSLVSWKHTALDDIADEYLEVDDNILDGYNILANTGSVYVPQLRDTDDPMERVIKLMIISMKLKLNEKRNSTDKEYAIDNLRSALNGATKNMSILKFLMWCDVLHLDWEFSLINSPDTLNPKLDSPVVISNKKELTADIPKEIKDSRIFYVPLVDPEDPLKRLIKVAIWSLQINLKDYKNKGTSSHCINNLRSGLKGKQKMSIQGLLKWCEILDLMLVIKVTNPETGIWYKAIGYDVFTNAEGDENANKVEEKER